MFSRRGCTLTLHLCFQESNSPTDRRQQTLSFSLTGDQLAKMKAPGCVPSPMFVITLGSHPFWGQIRSKYQLRLFCTSSIFYAGIGSFRSNALPCPMEFPPTCEVRVNGTQITANLKGLKKKPGTAPPPDIGKYSRITSSNKIEMVYVNSQQPVQSKVSDSSIFISDRDSTEQPSPEVLHDRDAC